MGERSVFEQPKAGDVVTRGIHSKKVKHMVPGGVQVFWWWLGREGGPLPWSNYGEAFYTLEEWMDLEEDGWEASE